jgi:hypothetical protein
MSSDPNGDEGVACLSARFPRGQPENTWALTAAPHGVGGSTKRPSSEGEGRVGQTAYTGRPDVQDRVPVEIPSTEAREAKWL